MSTLLSYFRPAAATPATPRPASAVERMGSSSSASGLRASKKRSRSSTPVPQPQQSEEGNWGALVVRRDQETWRLLKQLCEEPPAKWLMRSFTTSYKPVFQDDRTPGLGSCSRWYINGASFGGGAPMTREMAGIAQTSSEAAELTENANAATAAGLRNAEKELELLGGGTPIEDEPLLPEEERENEAAAPVGVALDNFRLAVEWLRSVGVCPHPGARSLQDVAVGSSDSGRSGGENGGGENGGGGTGSGGGTTGGNGGGGGTSGETGSGGGACGEERREMAGCCHLCSSRHPGREGMSFSSWESSRGSAPVSPSVASVLPALLGAGDDALALCLKYYNSRRVWHRVGVSRRDETGQSAGVATTLAASRRLLELGLLRPAWGGGAAGIGDAAAAGQNGFLLLVLEEAMFADELRQLSRRLGCLAPDAARGARRNDIITAIQEWALAAEEEKAPAGIKAHLPPAAGSGGGGSGSNSPAARWRSARLRQLAEEVAAVLNGAPPPPKAAANGRRRSSNGKSRSPWRGSGGGGSGGGGSDVIVVRLADGVAEALQRVWAAFFEAAALSPTDASALMAAPMRQLAFARPRHAPSGVLPGPLCGSAAFEEHYALLRLADRLEWAARCGDAPAAYGALHRASDALLPGSCGVCRAARGRAVPVYAAGVPRVLACESCELAAAIVRRGVGMLERERSYTEAIHYLQLLLRCPSLAESVWRPRHWLRLVTDLSHLGRQTEALRAAERAVAEASISQAAAAAPNGVGSGGGGGSGGSSGGGSGSGGSGSCSGAGSGGGSGNDHGGDNGEDVVPSNCGPRPEFAAAVYPLCELLALQLQVQRLAVPPLRWRRPQPRTLLDGGSLVMRMPLPRSETARAAANNDNGAGGSNGGRGGGGGGWRGRRGKATPAAAAAAASAVAALIAEEEAAAAAAAEAALPTREGWNLEVEVLNRVLAGMNERYGGRYDGRYGGEYGGRYGERYRGLHAENGPTLTLFGLLLWDVIWGADGDGDGDGRGGDGGGGAGGADASGAGAGSGGGGTFCSSGGRERGCGSGDGGDCGIAGPAAAVSAGIDATFASALPAKAEEEAAAACSEFCCPFSDAPRSLVGAGFRAPRARRLEAALRRVAAGGAEQMIRETWQRHYGELCRGVNWHMLDGDVAAAAAAAGSGGGNVGSSGGGGRGGSGGSNNGGSSGGGGGGDGIGSNASGSCCGSDGGGGDGGGCGSSSSSSSSSSSRGGDSVEEWVHLAQCMGPLVLTEVCEMLSTNYWGWRHGMPDLLIWERRGGFPGNGYGSHGSNGGCTGGSSGGGIGGGIGDGDSSGDVVMVEGRCAGGGDGSSINGGGQSRNGGGKSGSGVRGQGMVIDEPRPKCRWIEIKGPGDSLSLQQKAWIHRLAVAGADVATMRIVHDTNGEGREQLM